MIEKRSETRRWDQIIRTVYLLSSLGRGIRNVGGGTVQRLIAAHANAQNMEGNLFQLLQLFGITPLKSTIIQRRNKKCNEILEEGFDYSTTSKWDYIIKIFDNVHFVEELIAKQQKNFSVIETTHQVDINYTAEQATSDCC